MPDKPRVVILVEGGLVANIIADQEMDYAQIDYDVEGAEPEDIIKLDETAGAFSDVRAYKGPVEVDVAEVEHYWKQVPEGRSG